MVRKQTFSAVGSTLRFSVTIRPKWRHQKATGGLEGMFYRDKPVRLRFAQT